MANTPDKNESHSTSFLKEKFSRRKFLKGVAATAFLGLGISACATDSENTPDPRLPTETATNQPTEIPTPEKEATSTSTPVSPDSDELESIEKETIVWDTTELKTSKGQTIEFSLSKTKNDSPVEEVFAEMNIAEIKLNDLQDANGEKLNPNVESQLVKSIEGFFYLTYKYQNNLEDLTFEDFLANSAQNTILLPVWDKNQQKEVEIDVSLDQVKSFEMRYTSDTQEEARLQLLSKGYWPDNTQQGYDFNPQTGKFTLFCAPKIAPQYEIHLEQGEKDSIQAGFLSNIDFLYGLGYLPQRDFIRSQGGFSKVQNGELIKPILSLATISSTNPNYIGYEPGNLEDFLVTDLNTGKTTYNQKYPDQISAYKAYLNTVTVFTANSLR